MTTSLISRLQRVCSELGSAAFGGAVDSKGLGRVDITEVFSPVRVTEMAKRYQLKPGEAMDLMTGWDFDRKAHRDAAIELIRRTKPKLVIGSPDCTMYSSLQHMNSRSADRQKKWIRARKHLSFM